MPEPMTDERLAAWKAYAQRAKEYDLGSQYGREALADCLAEIDRLKAIVDRLEAAKLSQCGFEDSADIVLLNGEPVGGTITGHMREFDRWWPAVKMILLTGDEAVETAKETNDEASHDTDKTAGTQS